jgi:hypothetical protein
MVYFGRRLSGLNRVRRFLDDCARLDDLGCINLLSRILSRIIIPLLIGRSFVQVRGHSIAQGSQYCGNDKKHCGKRP